MNSKNNVVSVFKCKDYKLERNRVTEAISVLEDEGRLNPKVDTVFIKPNIALAAPSFHSPEGTEPDLIAALVQYFYERGGKVTVEKARPGVHPAMTPTGLPASIRRPWKTAAFCTISTMRPWLLFLLTGTS